MNISFAFFNNDSLQKESVSFKHKRHTTELILSVTVLLRISLFFCFKQLKGKELELRLPS